MGHWYHKDGTPCYQVEASSGKGFRDTTLRDARKLNLVRSVTEIIRVLDKPQLNTWKIKQILLAVQEAIKTNTKFLETDNWQQLILHKADTISRESRERGSQIHKHLEHYFKTGILDKEDQDFVIPVIECIHETFGKMGNARAEVNFAHKEGFGGQVDLIYGPYIIDFKTKAKEEIGIKDIYDDHGMQLAAYRKGLDMPKSECYNILISTTTPGELYIHQWKETDLARALHMFDTLNKFVKLQSGYSGEF